jgi:UDP-N-acetylmuramate: L-alanyl-gamma-D-glutamyl-meso-diaminopimelate ligase
VRNCLGAIAAAETLGISREAVSEALATFKSVKRRMEVRGIIDGITVIDDFAHHPTAVRETLAAAAQRYPGRRIVAVYEPRTWTARKKIFQAQYGEAFAPADVVIIAGLFEAGRISSSEQLSIDELIATLVAQGKRALTMTDADEIVARLVPELRSGDIVAVMSNGGFGGIHEKMLSALKGRTK